MEREIVRRAKVIREDVNDLLERLGKEELERVREIRDNIISDPFECTRYGLDFLDPDSRLAKAIAYLKVSDEREYVGARS